MKTKFVILVLVIVMILVVGVKSLQYDPPISSGRSTSSPAPSLSVRGLVLFSDVPFTSQAPFGGWEDPRQQDGCEEASALMAVRWVRGQSLSKDEALKEILAISDYEQATYGSYNDTNAHDTVERILKDYFKFTGATAQSGITTDDIKEELYKGRIVLVPVNGRKLGNPNYSGSGPERHMLVIIGYDIAKNQFITNDSGTRKGKGYRYSAAVLQGALREYPTGDHLPITDQSRTAMIVVSR